MKFPLLEVDAENLKNQIEEKRREELEQQKINRLFEEQLTKSDAIAVALEQKEREERIKLQQEINNYRKNYQKPEDRREFDLNDPNFMKKALPCRIRDDDPRLGPSSAQKFEGEDLSSDQRAKIQHEEIRAWLDQQMREKEKAEKDRKDAEDAYKAALIARDQRSLELEAMERECRKKLQAACLKFNKALAEEKLCQKQKLEHQTRNDNLAEICNAMTSDMLTENPEVAQSNLGLGRKIGFLYKGMTEEQKKQIRREQLAQIEEIKKKKELEERMNEEMDDYTNGIQKTIYLMDRELESKQRQRNKQLAEENKRMADEQNNHKKFLDKIVYSNVPTEAFYDQFNRSTR
ncbi:RIB43A-like with coiled-coils protein 2 isoform X2 [Leptinotarsa decemlineata]|uniref:RIB43A-like with coiled-coils protein 2 isoform X2 n=1 Tax=Leptinotarsa decemlineata TaxID=7539 RepID=UPI003D3046DD